MPVRIASARPQTLYGELCGEQVKQEAAES